MNKLINGLFVAAALFISGAVFAEAQLDQQPKDFAWHMEFYSYFHSR